MGSTDLSVGLSAGLSITPAHDKFLTQTTDSASCPASAFNVTCDMPVNKSSHIVSEAPHLMALWDRRRLAQAGNLDTLPRDILVLIGRMQRFPMHITGQICSPTWHISYVLVRCALHRRVQINCVCGQNLSHPSLFNLSPVGLWI